MAYVSDIEQKDKEALSPAAIHTALKHCNSHLLTVKKDVDIHHEDDALEYIYLVKSGLLYSYCLLADGKRQILYLYKAGDLAGFFDLGSKRSMCSLRCLEDCVLYPIPIADITSPSFLTPPVAAFFLRKSAEMQSILIQTLMAVGRMGARDRIVWLLLMLHERLADASVQDQIILPFNQSEMGDLIGLTNVSISKNLSQLSVEGFIERKGSRILLRRRKAMQRMIGYEPMNFPSDILFEGLAPKTLQALR